VLGKNEIRGQQDVFMTGVFLKVSNLPLRQKMFGQESRFRLKQNPAEAGLIVARWFRLYQDDKF